MEAMGEWAQVGCRQGHVIFGSGWQIDGVGEQVRIAVRNAGSPGAMMMEVDPANRGGVIWPVFEAGQAASGPTLPASSDIGSPQLPAQARDRIYAQLRASDPSGIKRLAKVCVLTVVQQRGEIRMSSPRL
jgi:hypothetical protein